MLKIMLIFRTFYRKYAYSRYAYKKKISVTNNMNMLPSRKYGVPPEEVENNSLESEEYKLDYDFKRLKKVDKDAARYS